MSKELSEETKALMYVNGLIKNVEEYKNKTGIEPAIRISWKVLIDIQQALLKTHELEKVLSVLKDNPFILQKIFENKGLKNQEEFDKRYFWGTITEDKVRIIKEWLDEKNN
jgi:hypothetical protein